MMTVTTKPINPNFSGHFMTDRLARAVTFVDENLDDYILDPRVSHSAVRKVFESYIHWICSHGQMNASHVLSAICQLKDGTLYVDGKTYKDYFGSPLWYAFTSIINELEEDPE